MELAIKDKNGSMIGCNLHLTNRNIVAPTVIIRRICASRRATLYSLRKGVRKHIVIHIMIGLTFLRALLGLTTSSHSVRENQTKKKKKKVDSNVMAQYIVFLFLVNKYLIT